METYEILLQLAIILLAAKLFGIVAARFKVPMVVGEIIAGLLVGPCLLGWVQMNDFVSYMAEIGVIMLMFSAGLETDLKELIKTGPIAFLIACAGVLVPLLGGTLLYLAFYGFDGFGTEHFFQALFIGTIMTATSVSITVASLKEMGKLKGRVGTTIMSAAIIDDVLGIIVLTFVLGFQNPENSVGIVVGKTILFFVIAIGGGLLIFKLFSAFDKQFPHTRRVPIISVCFCFFLAFIAEKYFGIADITGAYVAGIVLCNLDDASYIDRKVDINSYMMFAPVFFVSIGLKTTISGMNSTLLLFCVAFVLIALVTKIIGCGLMAKACRFDWNDSLKIGIGMMTRGEVALIVAQKGLDAGLVSADYFTAVILLILVSSIIVPIVLKMLYQKTPEQV